MGLHWSRDWGSETPTVLQDNAGFTFGDLTRFVEDNTDPYTYTGSPARYSMSIQGVGLHYVYLPASASPGAVGTICVPIRFVGGTFTNAGNVGLIEVESTDPARTTSVYIRPSGQSLALYVDNQLKETTGNFDWNDWHYIALRYDMSTVNWSGQIFVDGAAATALQIDATPSAITSTQLRVRSGGTTADFNTFIGGIIVYDTTADTIQPRFTTRINPNADGTNIGVWTPSVGVDDFDVVDSPIDPSTFTQNAAAVALDRCEVLTNSGGATIASLIGTTPSNIEGVVGHMFMTGQSITARALVGDSTGAAETAGPTEAVAAGTTSYIAAPAPLRPNGGVAWVGTDQPELIAEVVST